MRRPAVAPSSSLPVRFAVDAAPPSSPLARRRIFATATCSALMIAACMLGGCASGGQAGASPGVGDLIDSGDVKLVQITPQLVAANRQTKREPVPKELLDYRPESYQINPGDTIMVTVWDHPELNTNSGGGQDVVANGRLVHPDGTFYYPYVGTLKVAGMKIEDLRSTITTRLAQYLQTPQVDVNIVGYGSRITLQGAFKDTSSQSITTVPLTLSQAVGAAVVDAEQADLSGLVLTRDGKSHRIDMDALSSHGSAIPNIYLKPGDRLYMPFNDRKEAYVMGEVLRPQAISFKTSDLTLTQVLGRVGGLNPVTAKSEAVYVIRGVDLDNMERKPATVYQLDASTPAAYALADEFSVKPGDVVFVGEAGVTRWNRFLSQLLPLSGIIRNASGPVGN